ncbi:hypothetical protein Sru01_40250 [Sphaerisporangium rufum]|uniref:XRE family transcriptional regulator n=1 Tax=Sphaerisporangium rufum TaxID=1381558 RepID=A0A919R4N7_9ACTN|nr:hypothetical protein [Sphaerisporangium rufum]GII79043.1 hypothetical protein Sru01_40250 [Sphaerisporangium rufum]
MPGEGTQVLLECRRRSEALRAKGYTFEQIADLFAVFHDVSPLRRYRYAYGRTAAEAVALYNDLDPAGAAALRESRLYDFEHWPRRGQRPTARTVALFAQVYRTAARRLVTDEVYASYSPRDRRLIDATDHRHLPAQRASGAPSPFPGHVTMGQEAAVRDPVPAPTSQDCAALLRVLGAEEADVKRRDLLFELALALGGAPAVVLLRHLSPPEKDRLAAAVRATARVDAGTVEVIEKLTVRCRRLDDDHGPDTVLPIVDGQRRLVADLLSRATLLPDLRKRLTYAYAELSQFAGWLHHDLMDHAGARLRYQEGLAAAHQIGDPTMIAYLHTCLSYVAVFRGEAGEALDHVFAAQGWARRSPSNLMRSVHAMELARVLARRGETNDSERALAQAAALVEHPRTEDDPTYLYWFTIGQVQASTADCQLYWGRPDDAINSVTRTLAAPTTFSLARGHALLHYAEALTRKREVPGAVDKIRGAAQITTRHSSGRLADSVRQARARLQPWAGNKHVRTLDDELRALGIITATRE